MTEKIKTIIKNIINEDRPANETELKLITEVASDYCKDYDLKNAVKVELDDDNVGTILVEKDFVNIAERVNNLANQLYEYDDELAGFEYFSTIAYAIGMKWVSAYDDDEEDMNYVSATNLQNGKQNMKKVIEVWSGVYVGEGDYEGGVWDFKTKDGKSHNVSYEVADTDYDTLYKGLVEEVQLLKDFDVVDKDDLDLTFLDCAEKIIFYFDDGTKKEFNI